MSTRRRPDMEFSEEEGAQLDNDAFLSELIGRPPGGPVAQAAQLEDPRQHPDQDLEDMLAGFDVDRLMAEESDRMRAEAEQQPPTPHTPPSQANVGGTPERRNAGPSPELTTEDWLGRMERAGDRADALRLISQIGGHLDRSFGGGQRGDVYRGLEGSAQAPVERLKSSYQMWKDAQDQRLAQEREQRLEAAGATQQDYLNRNLERQQRRDEALDEYRAESLSSHAELQGQRLESQAELQGQRLEAQSQENELTRQSRERIAELRRTQRRGGARGVAAGRVADAMANQLRQYEQGSPDERIAAEASLSRTVGGRQALQRRAINARATTGQAQRAQEQLHKIGYDQTMAALDGAEPVLRRASDREVQQAVVALASGLVPDTSTGLGQAVENVNLPMRHSAFGATLTGNELQAFRRFSGQRVIDIGQARAMLSRYFANLRRGLNREANRITAAAGAPAEAQLGRTVGGLSANQVAGSEETPQQRFDRLRAARAGGDGGP